MQMLTLLGNAAEGGATLWLPESGGGFSDSVDPLFYFIYYVNVVFFVLVGVLMFLFAWRGRQKKSERHIVAEGSTHNTALEVAWTLPPLLLVLVMFLWGFRGYMDMYVVPPGGNAYVIDVEAYQWGWNFKYPNGGMTGGSNVTGDGVELHIPAGMPIEFRLSAKDVLHSFFVPAMRVKKDCVPGRYNRVWFEADASRVTPGNPVRYPIHCTEYCGQSHSQMNAILVVHHRDSFFDGVGMPDNQPVIEAVNTWNRENLTPVELGKQLHAQGAGCIQCHSLDGSRGTGPTWKNAWGAQHQMADGSQVLVDDAYILESIYYPGRKLVATYNNQMASYAGQLNYGDVRAIIEYMKTLADGYTGTPLAKWPEGYDGKKWIEADGMLNDEPPIQ